jgi:acyl carrier protein phosphodiesterase
MTFQRFLGKISKVEQLDAIADFPVQIDRASNAIWLAAVLFIYESLQALRCVEVSFALRRSRVPSSRSRDLARSVEVK